jgi:hypothetical protein
MDGVGLKWIFRFWRENAEWPRFPAIGPLVGATRPDKPRIEGAFCARIFGAGPVIDAAWSAGGQPIVSSVFVVAVIRRSNVEQLKG